MKTELLDYVLSTLVLTLAVAFSGSIAFWLLAAATGPALGAYGAVVDALVFLLVFGLVCAAFARAVLRFSPLPPGRYAMTDRRFTAWKLYTVLYEFGCGALKPFTVMFFRPLVQVLFGARIGKDTALGGKLVDPHLITLGDGAIVGEGSVVTAHAINSGEIVLGRVDIEPGATVGVGAVLYPGVRVGAGAVVAANAVVLAGTQIPSGEFWAGIPAKPVRSARDTHLDS
jgi:carbonic anhydrase/acetyltransferase-like protein (isoleucine patch superfamily)